MPFQVSPGVNVSEIDLTTVVPAIATTEGGIAGSFRWGPVEQPVLISTEDQLVDVFGTPKSDDAVTFFTASNFLAYGNALYTVRAVNGANNATTGSIAVTVKNDDDYEENFTGNTAIGNWVAKYPGELGNSLKVSFCQSADAFEQTVSVSHDLSAGNNTVVFASSVANTMVVGDILTLGTANVKEELKVRSISANGTHVVLQSVFTGNFESSANVTAPSLVRSWEYAGEFDRAPGTTPFATGLSSTNDECHFIVVDEEGAITGVPGNVLEKFSNMSVGSNARSSQGAGIFYETVINNQSQYIWFGNKQASDHGDQIVNGTTFSQLPLPVTESFALGTDGSAITAAQKISAYNVFKSAETFDVSFILGADAEQTVAVHLINNIAETRKDCLVVLSPRRADVVNNNAYDGKEVADIIDYRNLLPSTSYAVLDSGWKYQYDKYNDTYRYVPLNGDTAGLMVQTDLTRDPWFSPAGFNRGNVKNVIRLAFSPNQAQRDALYKKGINPVVTFAGQGTVLYGDKTMLSQPSAFDRINVRRLFIILEKAISTAAKFTLFEFNDEFTRSQFKNLVEPFLRDVQGRRGLTDFRVICDGTNNTGEVIDRNEFVGDIYIKPARSINFIQLNFVAVRTGVEFSEVVGQA